MGLGRGKSSEDRVTFEFDVKDSCVVDRLGLELGLKSRIYDFFFNFSFIYIIKKNNNYKK